MDGSAMSKISMRVARKHLAGQNKVVLDKAIDGASKFSEAAVKWMAARGKQMSADGSPLPRHDPTLVQCVEELGQKASAPGSKFVAVPIPGDRYAIYGDEYGAPGAASYFEVLYTPEQIMEKAQEEISQIRWVKV